jgi:7-cyano-7-deazaguanine synthase
MNLHRAAILLSGGMDSSTLLFHVKRTLGAREIHALSFVYGQKHARELEMARWQAQAADVYRHQVWDLLELGRMAAGSALTDPAADVPDMDAIPEDERRQPVTYVPNRNMVFLSLAAAYAEAHGIEDVFYGAQQQDEYGYWDCTEPFVERINAVLALNRRRPVRVHAPFAAMTKAAVLRLGRQLQVDYDHTWTCYRGGTTPCGTCPSCAERNRALRAVRAAPATTKGSPSP